MLSKNYMAAFVATLRQCGYHEWDIRREWHACELLRRVGVWSTGTLAYK